MVKVVYIQQDEATNIVELAKALGKARETVSRWMKRRDLPDDCRRRSNGSYHIPSWKKWLNSGKGAGFSKEDDEAPLSLDHQLKTVKVLREKLKYDQEREGHIKLSDGIDFVLELLKPLREQIDNLETLLVIDISKVVGQEHTDSVSRLVKTHAAKIRGALNNIDDKSALVADDEFNV